MSIVSMVIFLNSISYSVKWILFFIEGFLLHSTHLSVGYYAPEIKDRGAYCFCLVSFCNSV